MSSSSSSSTCCRLRLRDEEAIIAVHRAAGRCCSRTCDAGDLCISAFWLHVKDLKLCPCGNWHGPCDDSAAPAHSDVSHEKERSAKFPNIKNYCIGRDPT